MIIVGISGRIGHGKDAIAKRLQERWGFAVVSFASGLKEEVEERLPRTLRAMHDLVCTAPACLHVSHIRELVWNIKPSPFRELLQEYGSDVRRADQPDYWTEKWKWKAAAHRLVAVPDVRFPNEYAMLRSMGAKLWRVERPGFGPTEAATLHPSETSLDNHPWDAVLRNDQDLAHLYRLVDELVNPC